MHEDSDLQLWLTTWLNWKAMVQKRVQNLTNSNCFCLGLYCFVMRLHRFSFEINYSLQQALHGYYTETTHCVYTNTIATQILHDYYTDTIRVLRGYCKATARIQHDYCTNTTRVLHEYYKDITRILHRYYKA